MATFLLDPDVTYLNHGSFGATPVEVLDAQDRWRRELEREPVDFLARRLEGLLRAAVERAARFVGARPADLVFVPNATTGVQAVLASLDLGPGDVLLTTDHRYDAVRRSMDAVATVRGARVVEAPLPFPVARAQDLAEPVIAAMTGDTRLVVVDQVTSPTALVLPLGPILAAARERGIPVLVDGAHAPGMLDLDLEALGADWWVGNLHKWPCAAKGTALLWAHPRHQARLHAPVVSHGHGKGIFEEFHWPGTFDPSAWLASTTALDLHDALGGATFRAAHHALVREGRQVLAGALGVDLPHPDDQALYGSMASLPLDLPAERARDLNHLLFHEHRIEVVVHPWRGRSLLRVSGFAGYNRPEDYHRLARVLPGALVSVAR